MHSKIFKLLNSIIIFKKVGSLPNLRLLITDNIILRIFHSFSIKFEVCTAYSVRKSCHFPPPAECFGLYLVSVGCSLSLKEVSRDISMANLVFRRPKGLIPCLAKLYQAPFIRSFRNIHPIR